MAEMTVGRNPPGLVPHLGMEPVLDSARVRVETDLGSISVEEGP